MISPGEGLCHSSRDAITGVKALISCSIIPHYGQSNLTRLLLNSQKKFGNLRSVVRYQPTLHCNFLILLEATAHTLHGAAAKDYSPSADDFRQAELKVIRQAQ